MGMLDKYSLHQISHTKLSSCGLSRDEIQTGAVDAEHRRFDLRVLARLDELVAQGGACNLLGGRQKRGRAGALPRHYRASLGDQCDRRL